MTVFGESSQLRFNFECVVPHVGAQTGEVVFVVPRVGAQQIILINFEQSTV